MYQSQFPALEEHFPVADRSASRMINQRAILDKIYQENGISKAKLAKDLGISKPAVASNVANLILTGLVQEKGTGEASVSGGRKPVMLFFNPSYCYIGVVDLSLQTPVCVVFDMGCRMIGMKKITMHSGASKENRRQCIREALIQTLMEVQIPSHRLGIIVISQPGMITDNNGTYYLSGRHYPWTELGLKSFLQQYFDVPVLIQNDVNLAAVGEVHFGTNVRLRDLIYLSCGIGLGAGIVIRGELYEGSSHAAGEVGVMLRSSGGCLEDSVVVEGLIDRTQKLYAEAGRHETVTFPMIVERLKHHDTLPEQAVYEVGRELGRVIQNTRALLDIPTVIFGGEYLELGPVLFQGMKDFIDTAPAARCEVIPSTLGNKAGLYGGCVVGKEKIFSMLVGSDNEK